MNNTHKIKALRRFLDESLSKTMSKVFLIVAILAISCEPANLTDLTPGNGHNAEFAFNVPLLNEVIYNDGTVVDSGWIVLDTMTDIRVPSIFKYDIQFIATDTFAFEWHDYEPVTSFIHRIANGFDITFTVPSSQYGWLNYAQFYSKDSDYLIPMFNSKGQRYFLQVFRKRKSFFQTYYTARGVWAISKPKTIKGDVS